jgi:hypothetical protein
MARRWYVPLLALPVVIGTVVAVAVGVASASPGLTHAAAQVVFPGAPMIRSSGGAEPSLGTNSNTMAESSNWSGYGLVGGRGAFHSVSASWVQPKAHCAGVAGHKYAAFWVGLDGFASKSVEQTGSDSDCRGKVPTYYGWYEMYPAGPVLYRNKVGAGDHMSASVTFRGPSTYVLVLRDSTRHWVHTVTKREAGLARSSAEVITEAPALAVTGKILPLADFGTVRFAGARVNGKVLRTLHPIKILMLDSRGLLKDTTSNIGLADAFTNVWKRSN